MEQPNRGPGPTPAGAPAAGDPATDPDPADLDREQLLALVERLRAETADLRQQLAKAVKARDAVIAQVLPLSTPPGERSPGGRKIMIVLLGVLLAGAIFLLADLIPRMMRRVEQPQRLPTHVRVVQDPTAPPTPAARRLQLLRPAPRPAPRAPGP